MSRNFEFTSPNKFIPRELSKYKNYNLGLLKFENINIFYPAIPIYPNFIYKILPFRIIIANTKVYRNWVVRLTLRLIKLRLI